MHDQLDALEKTNRSRSRTPDPAAPTSGVLIFLAAHGQCTFHWHESMISDCSKSGMNVCCLMPSNFVLSMRHDKTCCWHRELLWGHAALCAVGRSRMPGRSLLRSKATCVHVQAPLLRGTPRRSQRRTPAARARRPWSAGSSGCTRSSRLRRPRCAPRPCACALSDRAARSHPCQAFSPHVHCLLCGSRQKLEWDRCPLCGICFPPSQHFSSKILI